MFGLWCVVEDVGVRNVLQQHALHQHIESG